jgi:hypothetical protein
VIFKIITLQIFSNELFVIGLLVISILLAILVPIIFYLIQKRTITKLEFTLNHDDVFNQKIKPELTRISQRIDTVRESFPHLAMITDLKYNFEILKSDLEDNQSNLKLETASQIKAISHTTQTQIKSDVAQFAKNQITQNTIHREEFEELCLKIDSYLGNDDDLLRIKTLHDIFDSKKSRTLTWQCDLLDLLKHGIAPEIQQELLHSKAIPTSAYVSFLKKLDSANIIISSNVTSYQLDENYWWIYNYTKNPQDLKSLLEKSLVKEKQYQNYVCKNLSKIESNLSLLQSEYSLNSGSIDFLCLDGNGNNVGLELKYPKAHKRDCRQLDGYKKEYLRTSASLNFRGILVSPEISDDVKNELTQYGLEYCELTIDLSNK